MTFHTQKKENEKKSKVIRDEMRKKGKEKLCEIHPLEWRC